MDVFVGSQLVAQERSVSGAFASSFAVPVIAGGSQEIRAVGSDTGETQFAPFTVVPTITAVSGSVMDLGQPMTVTGVGAARETTWR